VSRFVLLARGDVVDLIGPYLPDLVDALKREIPWRARRWDADLKCWTVDVGWAGVARSLAVLYAGAVVGAVTQEEAERRARAAASRAPAAVDADADALGVAPSAPVEVIQAAYRALARLHHPDLVGEASTARMQAINAAYERLMARRAHGEG